MFVLYITNYSEYMYVDGMTGFDTIGHNIGCRFRFPNKEG